MNIEKILKAIKLTKHASVGDSDKLKQMAYKFAQMGNYFDRANSARARNILAKEDDKKYPEFYSYGLQVLEQLKKEVEGIKANATPANYSRSFDNETLALLNDGANRLYWAASDRRDKKGEVVGKKIVDLAKEYRKGAYDSIKDGWMNVRGTTRQGYEVRAIYNGKSGRLYAVIYRPKTNDFLVAAGYNQQRGDWDQGYYDYKSEEEARKFAEKHAKQMSDSVKDSYIELDFNGDNLDAQLLAKKFGCSAEYAGKANGYPIFRFKGTREQLKKLVKHYGMDEKFFNQYVEDSVKDALYTYEFPKFTAEDRSQARRYGLEIIRETSQDTIVRGDLKKIKEFADNYLGYQLNKDYLSKDSVKDENSFQYRGIFVIKSSYGWKFIVKGQQYECATDKEAIEKIDELLG